LLTKTRLQIHVIFEVMHCKSPKHMLTEIIDHVSPTLVILGSRGRSALKGVLLGSFSNYIVERSSVPVMVARRKLQKTKNKGLNVRLANNLRRTQLSDAKID
jgi:nucleotide-binding universal stress UspA family protein